MQVAVATRTYSAYLKEICGKNPGKIYPLDEAQIRIGRCQTAHVKVLSRNASRNHCMLENTDSGWTITDTSSINGVYIDGVHLNPGDAGQLRNFARIHLGPPEDNPYCFEFRCLSSGTENRSRNRHSEAAVSAQDRNPDEPDDAERSSLSSHSDSDERHDSNDEHENSSGGDDDEEDDDPDDRDPAHSDNISGDDLDYFMADIGNGYEDMLGISTSNENSVDEAEFNRVFNNYLSSDSEGEHSVQAVSSESEIEVVDLDEDIPSTSDHVIPRMSSESVRYTAASNYADSVPSTYVPENSGSREAANKPIPSTSSIKREGPSSQDEEYKNEFLKSKIAVLEKQLEKSEAEKSKLRENLSTVVNESNQRKRKLEEISDAEEGQIVPNSRMETELLCGVCTEMFISPVTLNCSHTFCETCILQWKQRKNQCPMCRTRIISDVRSLALDNIVDMVISTYSEEYREKRIALVKERADKLKELKTADNVSRFTFGFVRQHRLRLYHDDEIHFGLIRVPPDVTVEPINLSS